MKYHQSAEQQPQHRSPIAAQITKLFEYLFCIFDGEFSQHTKNILEKCEASTVLCNNIRLV